MVVFGGACGGRAHRGILRTDRLGRDVLGSVFSTLKRAVLNPYVCFTVIASVWNAVVDPTTKGFSDSEQALSYERPKCDK